MLLLQRVGDWVSNRDRCWSQLQPRLLRSYCDGEMLVAFNFPTMFGVYSGHGDDEPVCFPNWDILITFIPACDFVCCNWTLKYIGRLSFPNREVVFTINSDDLAFIVAHLLAA